MNLINEFLVDTVREKLKGLVVTVELTDIVKASLLALIPLPAIIQGSVFFGVLLVINMCVYAMCVQCRQRAIKFNVWKCATTVVIATLISWSVGIALTIVSHNISGTFWSIGISIVMCVISCYSSGNPVRSCIATIKELLLAWRGVDSDGKTRSNTKDN